MNNEILDFINKIYVAINTITDYETEEIKKFLITNFAWSVAKAKHRFMKKNW